MKLSMIAVGTLCLGLAVGIAGCDDEEPAGGDGGAGRGGSGGSTGGSGGSTGGSGGSAADAAGETGSAAGYATVKPIFMAKCGTCHVPGGMGALFHTLAASSADAKKNATTCPGKTKGACTLDRVKAGTMPQGAMCSGNPTTDASNAKCLTAAEQATLQAWITAGTPD